MVMHMHMHIKLKNSLAYCLVNESGTTNTECEIDIIDATHWGETETYK